MRCGILALCAWAQWATSCYDTESKSESEGESERGVGNNVPNRGHTIAPRGTKLCGCHAQLYKLLCTQRRTLHAATQTRSPLGSLSFFLLIPLPPDPAGVRLCEMPGFICHQESLNALSLARIPLRSAARARGQHEHQASRRVDASDSVSPSSSLRRRSARRAFLMNSAVSGRIELSTELNIFDPAPAHESAYRYFCGPSAMPHMPEISESDRLRQSTPAPP